MCGIERGSGVGEMGEDSGLEERGNTYCCA